jgi:hypothetical protein
MNTGLLWYDNDPKTTLEDKIGRAAQRYQEKYGRWPNTCFVHPLAMNGGAQPKDSGYGIKSLHGEIRVCSAPFILLHHLWLGENLGESANKAKDN